MTTCREQAEPSAWELGLFAPSVSQLTLEETVAELARHGYRWVEWRVQTAAALAASPWGPARNTLVLERLLEDVARVRPLLDEVGLATCGLQADVSAGDEAGVRAVIDAAAALGCRPGRIQAPAFDPARGHDAPRAAFRAELEAWIRQAAGRGVRICLETHFATIAPSAALAVGLLQGFDPSAVGVMWDPANQVWEGSEAPTLALGLLDAYLAEVHLKNGCWRHDEEAGWTFDWCGLDEGMVDWPAVLGLVRGAGYTGPLVVEDYRPLDPAVKLAQPRAYLAELASR